MKIINKKYNISNTINKKIVLISDIHYHSKKDILRLNNILDNIKKLKPNYICITGDITDKSSISDFNLLIEWLNKLANITKVIMVLGNHEYYTSRKGIYKLNSEYINKFKNINNLILLNNSIVIDNINFIGLNLPIEHYVHNKESKEDFKKYLKKVKTNNKLYNVLLCHSPLNLTQEDIIDNINVDLVLCGHTHGGIVPNIFRIIFKNRGFLSPQRHLFPKNVYGMITLKNKNVIITSGIKVLSESHCSLLKNVFSSEIVEINI